MSEVREEYIWLNHLRDSGETNMFGAAPYLEFEFGLTNREARKVLTGWMQWVNENPENVNIWE